MRNLILLAFLSAAGTAAHASTDLAAAAEIAKSNGCYSCHAAAEKIVGPAFNSVAEKYAGDKAAADALATKVMKGTKGAWGPVPMPANPQVNEADAKKLVAWILSLK